MYENFFKSIDLFVDKINENLKLFDERISKIEHQQEIIMNMLISSDDENKEEPIYYTEHYKKEIERKRIELVSALLYYDHLKKEEEIGTKLSVDQWKEIIRSGIEELGLGTIRKEY